MEISHEIDDHGLQALMTLAQSKCLYHLQNEADAQDVSQSVIIELIMNLEKVKIPEAWILGTARNKCYEFMRKKTSYRKMLSKLQTELNVLSAIKLEDLNNDEIISFEKLISQIPSEYISPKDQDLFMEYINSNSDYQDLAIKFSLNPETLRKRIYTIKRDITAWINLQRGVTKGRSQIVGAHLNKNILNFAQRFQKCAQDNDWQPVQSYLAPSLEIPPDFTIPFYKKQYYEVFYQQNNEYLIKIFYHGKQKQASGYTFMIRIIKSHTFQVIRFPKPIRKIGSLILKDMPQEIQNAFSKKKNGKLLVSVEDFMALLKKYNITPDVIFEGSK